MKKTLFLFSLLSLSVLGFSQITLESGAQLIISSGSTVIANDGIVNNNGSINNSGTVEIKGNLENNTSTLITSGSTGTVKFNGSAAQEITGTADANFYGNLEIDNTNGVALTATTTGSDQTINGTLVFTNGLLTLNGFNLTLLADATGVASGKYVQTNGSGSLKRTVGSSDVLFQVGNLVYNPVTLNNVGTSDIYNVRVVDAEPAVGSTAHFVDRSWVITEGTALGSDLTVTPQWNSGEELSSFDRTNSSIGLTTDGGSTYAWSTTGTATGSDPYTFAGAGFTNTGTFTVGDYFYSGKSLDLKLFLAGAYNGSTMNKALNTATLIPTTDPYGLGTTVASIPTDAIDWVKVELRDATTPATVVHSFAFFIDVNGDLLDTDGATGGKIFGFDNSVNYNVAVLHRNHLGIMTSTSMDLSATSPNYDFTTAQAQAWDDATVSTNNAMKDISGVFCLWEGDANGNGSLVYNGGNSDRVEMLDDVGGVSNMSTVISSVYSTSDVNMDGNIVYNGGGSDRVKLLDNVGGVSNMSTVLQKHLP